MLEDKFVRWHLPGAMLKHRLCGGECHFYRWIGGPHWHYLWYCRHSWSMRCVVQMLPKVATNSIRIPLHVQHADTQVGLS